MIHRIAWIVLFALAAFQSAAAARPPWQAKDLNPVTLKPAPKHAPVTLVRGGKPAASIVRMENAPGARDLQRFIAAATGSGTSDNLADFAAIKFIE